MPKDRRGFRGAVLLGRGLYRLFDALQIRADGVVLRGEGGDANGTVLLGTGRNQVPLIFVSGKSGWKEIQNTRQAISNPYVPVGGHGFTVADASGFAVGDSVMVVLHKNAVWLRPMKMDQITPRPGHPARTVQWFPLALTFDRVVTNIQGNFFGNVTLAG